MLTPADIRSGIAGALALLRDDPGAMRHFDLSFEGFWKSFLAILVIAPVLLLYIHGEWLIVTGAGLHAQRSYAALVAAGSPPPRWTGWPIR